MRYLGLCVVVWQMGLASLLCAADVRAKLEEAFEQRRQAVEKAHAELRETWDALQRALHKWDATRRQDAATATDPAARQPLGQLLAEPQRSLSEGESALRQAALEAGRFWGAGETLRAPMALCLLYGFPLATFDGMPDPRLNGIRDTLLEHAHASAQLGDFCGELSQRLLLDPNRAESNLPLLNLQTACYGWAERGFAAALDLDRAHPLTYFKLGSFSYQRARYQEASLYLLQGLRLDEMAKARMQAKWAHLPEEERPADTGHFTTSEQAAIWLRLGTLWERAGEASRALNAYRLASELDPKNPRPRISLAVAENVWGQPSRAVQALEPWLQEEPVEPPSPSQHALLALGHYTLGYAHESTGDLEGSLEAYQRALEHAQASEGADGADVERQARFAARRIKRMLRRFAQAAEPPAPKPVSAQPNPEAVKEPPPPTREEFQMAMEMLAQGVARKAEALEEPGKLQEQLRALATAPDPEKAALRKEKPLFDLLDAIKSFEEGLKFYRENGRLHREAGMAFLMLGDLRQARAHLEAAQVYDPLSPGILQALGRLELDLGSFDQAHQTFLALVELDPEFAPGHLGLASVMTQLAEKRQQIEQARYALERAEALGAGLDRVLPARAALTNLVERLDRGEKIQAMQSQTAKVKEKSKTKHASSPEYEWSRSIWQP